jgi:hypothetical protein
MAFRSLLKPAAKRLAQRLGFSFEIDAEQLARNVINRPGRITERQAETLVQAYCLASGKQCALARQALQAAALANGRNVSRHPIMEPRLRKASTARLAFWATDRGTLV